MTDNKQILTINAGSSSIKFALFEEEKNNKQLFGKIDRIGLSGTNLTIGSTNENKKVIDNILLAPNQSPADFLVDWLEKQEDFNLVKAIGHRIVHGMKHTQPEKVTPGLLDELKQIIPYDPDHLPLEIELIEAIEKRYPHLPQICCFDTAFHASMPRVARLLPIPRRFSEQGIERYGFHGLSYTYLMEELTRAVGDQAAKGRIILAHLGNGASITAVRNGKSIDTSMGFTPAGGLPMGSRPGDIDPGVWEYILKKESFTNEQFTALINHQCGLLGISETSGDMRDLLSAESKDVRAAEAIELFCYQIKKWIGAFTAVLGGLDTLVFTGGIGENQPIIRQRVCKGLQYLGVELDGKQNEMNAPVISIPAGPVTVRVIRTDEEKMIAKSVARILKTTKS